MVQEQLAIPYELQPSIQGGYVARYENIRGVPTTTDGSFERTIFIDYVNQPPTPTEPSILAVVGETPAVPDGWSLTPSGSVIWASLQRVRKNETDVTYTTPVRWNGTKGEKGDPGDATNIPEQRVLVGEQPSADSVDKFIIRDEEAYLTDHTVVHRQAPNTGTFSDFMDADLIGFLEFDPDVNSYNVGQWYFNPLRKIPRVVTDTNPIMPGVQKGWIDATFQELVAGNGEYRGAYVSDAEALQHIGKATDVYFDETNVSLREANSDFRLGSGTTHDQYDGKKLVTDSELAPVSELVRRNASDVAELESSRATILRSIADNEGRITTAEGNLASLGDIQSVGVGTAASYQATLNSQRNSAQPLSVSYTHLTLPTKA